MAHLSGSMQRCHPIIGSDARVSLAILDQILDNLQMTLLAGQVERCGTILSLGVYKAEGGKKKQTERQVVFKIH